MFDGSDRRSLKKREFTGEIGVSQKKRFAELEDPRDRERTPKGVRSHSREHFPAPRTVTDLIEMEF